MSHVDPTTHLSSAKPVQVAQAAAEQVPAILSVEKSYLVQKFARLNFGQFSVVGSSTAGEETVVQIPELNVCFDIGRGPPFALTSDILCLTHAHMDHVAGLGFYCSQRHFMDMKPGVILVPAELHRPIENLLRAWRDLERQHSPYELIAMNPGDVYPVRRDFAIRAYGTHHGGASLGYGLISIREKLKPEYVGRTGPELVELKKSGVEIQYTIRVPQVVFLGDTTDGPVFDEPDVCSAQVLITECTFYDDDHRQKAKAGRHLHLDQFLNILPNLNNQHIVIAHVSRRTGVRRARKMLMKHVPPAWAGRIHFLNDFDQSSSAGDIADTVQAPD